MFWGDSHARALAPAADKSSLETNVAGYLSAMPSCPPLMGFDFAEENRGICNTYNEMVLEFIETHPNIKTVILAGRWAGYAEGVRYKNEGGTVVRRVDILTNQDVTGTNWVEAGINRTMSRLIELDRTIVIVLSVPDVGYDVPSSYTIAARTGRDINQIIAPTYREHLERNTKVTNAIKKIVEQNTVQLIDPSQALCSDDICYVIIDGKLLYRDSHHLSTSGAYYISYLFNPIFEYDSLK